MRTVYLSLSSNLGDRKRNFDLALDHIASTVGQVVDVSSYYDTAPLNPPELTEESQPDFLNAVLICKSELSPDELIETVLGIEKTMGRDRAASVKWGPRLIDIDILFIDQLCINTARLTVPHRELHKRDFVLVPLVDLSPQLMHPVLQQTVGEILQRYYAGGGERFVPRTEHSPVPSAALQIATPRA